MNSLYFIQAFGRRERQDSKIILPTLFSLDPDPVTLRLTYPLIFYQSCIFGMIVSFLF